MVNFVLRRALSSLSGMARAFFRSASIEAVRVNWLVFCSVHRTYGYLNRFPGVTSLSRAGGNPTMTPAAARSDGIPGSP